MEPFPFSFFIVRGLLFNSFINCDILNSKSLTGPFFVGAARKSRFAAFLAEMAP